MLMLQDLYDKLCDNSPRDVSSFYGNPLTDENSIWFAIDYNTFPILLIPAQEDDVRSDIILRSIEVLFSRVCDIDGVDGQTQKGCYTLIQLKESDADIVHLFLRILEERFCSSKYTHNNLIIAENIQEIAALFSRIKQRKHDLIGLWGELHVIRCAQNLKRAVECWSVRRTEKYDFVTDSFVLEVKATLGTHRKHHFALEQLRPRGNFEAFVASVCVVEVQGGETVSELMEALIAQIHDENLRNKFLQQCISKGGLDLYRSDMALQIYPDNSTLMLYQAEDIPAPYVESTDPIDNVRFDADLSDIEPLQDERAAYVMKFSS